MKTCRNSLLKIDLHLNVIFHSGFNCLVIVQLLNPLHHNLSFNTFFLMNQIRDANRVPNLEADILTLLKIIRKMKYSLSIHFFYIF